MLLSHAELTLTDLPESRKLLLSDLIHRFPVQCTIEKFLRRGGAKGNSKRHKKCRRLVGWRNLKATRNKSQAALLLLADTLNCFHVDQNILEILYQQRQLSLSALTAAPVPWLQDRAAGRGFCCWLGQGRSRALQSCATAAFPWDQRVRGPPGMKE